MNISKLKFACSLVAITLSSCGGGGIPSSNTSAPTLTFPLQRVLKESVIQGAATNYTISGSCSGTASITSSIPTSATFEGVLGTSVVSISTIYFYDCSPPTFSNTYNDYYDSDYVPTGSTYSGGYGVFQVPPNIPVSVKVGDASMIGTQTIYTDNTRIVVDGRDEFSFVVEPDTADTAIVNMISKSYDANGALTSTEQNRYRITTSGNFTPVSSDLELSGSTTHLLFTVIPDNAPPVVFYTSPPNNAIYISPYDAITATFNKAIDPATMTEDTFKLNDGAGNAVAGSVTYNGTIATFEPSAPLDFGTEYLAMITTGIKDIAGNSLASNYSWNFTTDSSLFKSRSLTQIVSQPEALAIGDVNGDGRNDVVFTTSFFFDPVMNNYKFFVSIQNANGELDSPHEYPTHAIYGCLASTVAIGDVNNDGKNDIVIGYKYVTDYAGVGDNICSNEVFIQNSLGGFNTGIAFASVDRTDKIRVADLNHDGKLDVVGVAWGGYTGTVNVWLQNASGSLNAPVVYNVDFVGLTDLDVGDVNNDGLTDIVAICGPYGTFGILTQTSNGTFNPPVYYSTGVDNILWGIAVGDVTGDELNDVVVTILNNQPSPNPAIGIFSQNVLGTLEPVVKYESYHSPQPIEIADVTGDGKKDIVILHGGWDTMGVYEQQANGLLKTEQLYVTYLGTTGNFSANGLAVADINSDGRADVVFADTRNNLLYVLDHY